VSHAVTLILGGARSGKSDFAERLARASGQPVVFLATAVAGDAEMAARIARHRAARPAEWRTVEEPEELARAVGERGGPGDLVVIDCLTLWVSNVLLRQIGDSDRSENLSGEAWLAVESDLLARVEELLATARTRELSLILVSNEVGLGVVPATALGRRYRDVLGRVNRAVARRADRVLLMVAGLPLDVGQLVPGDLRHLVGDPW
jgi:adenosylcobinamide kinase/adenosylcobinamide-phosphate guanylyltransferase